MGRFVLIDDDPAYGMIMHKAALKRGLTLDVFESLDHMASIGSLGFYDAALVDYDLGHMTGVEIGEYLVALFNGLPMILISYQNREMSLEHAWPQSIKTFIHKSESHDSILSALEDLKPTV